MSDIWQWLLRNREWVFSGIGVAILSALALLLRQVARRLFRRVPPPADLAHPETEPAEELPGGGYRIAVSQRFHRALALINEGREFDPVDVPRLSHALAMDAPSELQSYFGGAAEPAFTFLDRVSDRFGLNPSWLRHGLETPFLSLERPFSNPFDYLPRILDLAPQALFFVRNLTPSAEATIVVEVSPLKYLRLGGSWNMLVHVSSHVGGSGAAALFGLYRLLRAVWDQASRARSAVLGCDLHPQMFARLIEGNLYPGIVEYPIARMGRAIELFDSPRPPRQSLEAAKTLLSPDSVRISNWHIELMNTSLRKGPDDYYRDQYGEEFIKAQAIVRSFLPPDAS